MRRRWRHTSSSAKGLSRPSGSAADKLLMFMEGNSQTAHEATLAKISLFPIKLLIPANDFTNHQKQKTAELSETTDDLILECTSTPLDENICCSIELFLYLNSGSARL